MAGLLGVIACMAVMSAIIFPRFATPSNIATIGVVESVASVGFQQVILAAHAHISPAKPAKVEASKPASFGIDSATTKRVATGSKIDTRI